jgi:hypothetical protein
MAPIVLDSDDHYDCSSDGPPNIIINAGRGNGPVTEFFFLLFYDCLGAERR